MNTKILVAIILIALFITGVSYAADVKTNITPGNKSAIAGASATTPSLAHKPGMKAERGVKNILFGWTDIPRSIIEVTMSTKNPVWGLAAGTFNGMGKAFPRTVSGITDIVTLPAARVDEQPVKADEFNTQIR